MLQATEEAVLQSIEEAMCAEDKSWQKDRAEWIWLGQSGTWTTTTTTATHLSGVLEPKRSAQGCGFTAPLCLDERFPANGPWDAQTKKTFGAESAGLVWRGGRCLPQHTSHVFAGHSRWCRDPVGSSYTWPLKERPWPLGRSSRGHSPTAAALLGRALALLAPGFRTAGSWAGRAARGLASGGWLLGPADRGVDLHGHHGCGCGPHLLAPGAGLCGRAFGTLQKAGAGALWMIAGRIWVVLVPRAEPRALRSKKHRHPGLEKAVVAVSPSKLRVMRIAAR